MSDDVRRALAVTADLRLDVDGVPARVTADGARLTVTVDDPVAVWNSLRAVPTPVGVPPVGLRGSLRRVAELLDEAGLTALVTGAAGPVLELGHDVDSRLGRALTGTPHVAAGRTRVLLPQAASFARDSQPVRLVVAALGAAAVGYAVLRSARGGPQPGE